MLSNRHAHAHARVFPDSRGSSCTSFGVVSIGGGVRLWKAAGYIKTGNMHQNPRRLGLIVSRTSPLRYCSHSSRRSSVVAASSMHWSCSPVITHVVSCSDSSLPHSSQPSQSDQSSCRRLHQYTKHITHFVATLWLGMVHSHALFAPWGSMLRRGVSVTNKPINTAHPVTPTPVHHSPRRFTHAVAHSHSSIQSG